ncbi:hypothetical protein [Zoogloea sp.]|uniref:hypothetical protein n=3 Tax=Zoogloea sp. TaxID=49181 RepID=UPI0035B17D20
MHDPSLQLQHIQSMLTRGQRNLRMERHTLVLWGLGGGGLVASSDWVLTAEQIPDANQRAVAWLIYLALSLFGVGYADWRLTARVKAARDETWSFIHRQVIKLLWLLMGLGTLFTFSTFFFGGGYMLYAVWLVLIGLALYVHGLFSEEALEWAGGLIILIAITALAAQLPNDTMKWLTASVFGIGLPTLALLLDGGRQRGFGLRLGQALGWTGLVLTLPLLAHRQLLGITPPELPVEPLSAYLSRPDKAGTHRVRLPAGSRIPVHLQLTGDVFRPDPDAVLPLTLDQDLDVLLEDGTPTGDIRAEGQPWQSARQTRWISIPWLKASIDPLGPRIDGALGVDFNHYPHR